MQLESVDLHFTAFHLGKMIAKMVNSLHLRFALVGLKPLKAPTRATRYLPTPTHSYARSDRTT